MSFVLRCCEVRRCRIQGRTRGVINLSTVFIRTPDPLAKTRFAQAYAFNNRLLTGASKQNVDTDPMTLEFIRTDKGHVVIETVKKAEDGNGFIVRLYESLRRRGPVTLSTGFAIEKCCRVNLLEENLDAVAFDDKEIQLDIKPFEIVSLRIVPAPLVVASDTIRSPLIRN